VGEARSIAVGENSRRGVEDIQNMVPPARVAEGDFDYGATLGAFVGKFVGDPVGASVGGADGVCRRLNAIGE
jgi:hypothetical protein